MALRERLVALDTEMLHECRRVFANAETTAKRARRFNGVEAAALYHPPRLAARLRRGPMGAYMLSVGRLESVKRVELAIRAMSHAPASLSLKIVGTGTRSAELEALSRTLGSLEPRPVPRRGGRRRTDRPLRGALGVIFPPYDEDYGYVTLEAFLSGKPVVTTTDAGGPTEFVDGRREWPRDRAGPGGTRRRDPVSRGRPPACRVAGRCRATSARAK